MNGNSDSKSKSSNRPKSQMRSQSMNQLPKFSNQLSNEEFNGHKHTPKQKTDDKTAKLLVSAEQEAKVSALMSPHIMNIN